MIQIFSWFVFPLLLNESSILSDFTDNEQLGFIYKSSIFKPTFEKSIHNKSALTSSTHTAKLCE